MKELIPLETFGQFLLATDWREMTEQCRNKLIDKYTYIRNTIITVLFLLTPSRNRNVIS
jgi:hypothetical protein